ncbi:hypothetical protein MJO28_007322 [Puccinia striiformis f. sp. tritici]|uniref:Uncharacterized protein n=3 Tax=Puccinia striiformis TaxID=27350 RepID=A0A0L0VHV2_9BASI|nr:hypothetical protein Pst134EB_014410 [Puccinia striiformis f. sp. tritici]KAI7951638.1 hypothetical protein MJO28_007322 [Puccinia striiformis f. sp. tritici]KAI9607643.1 hypothetical protein KEM48_003553 [Puccinia striiformis f. sp. tritici PST-130]KNE98838.1 hypothetical protein PSTG_07860 [Puccinia striiformis f. sp. tritici PST-78]POV99883.1 hypothetical protein PSHT_13338 [Puccinia striiformis]
MNFALATLASCMMLLMANGVVSETTYGCELSQRHRNIPYCSSTDQQTWSYPDPLAYVKGAPIFTCPSPLKQYCCDGQYLAEGPSIDGFDKCSPAPQKK